ncbi:MAG: YraN family protein [Bythopirellula sp.]|nr:YraN family protein [Bythopirellula sp.]
MMRLFTRARASLRWPRRAKTLGERGEIAAAKFLKRLGYRIVTTRFRQRYGEVDIIAVDGQTVVFVEVKTRRLDLTTQPAEAVDFARQQRLTRAALAFLKFHGLLEYPSRFDVIEVVWPEKALEPQIRHIIDAFPAVGRRQFFS